MVNAPYVQKFYLPIPTDTFYISTVLLYLCGYMDTSSAKKVQRTGGGTPMNNPEIEPYIMAHDVMERPEFFL